MGPSRGHSPSDDVVALALWRSVQCAEYGLQCLKRQTMIRAISEFHWTTQNWPKNLDHRRYFRFHQLRRFLRFLYGVWNIFTILISIKLYVLKKKAILLKVLIERWSNWKQKEIVAIDFLYFEWYPRLAQLQPLVRCKPKKTYMTTFQSFHSSLSVWNRSNKRFKRFYPGLNH